MAATTNDYYALLDVARDASTEEIRAAIKKQRTVWSTRASLPGAAGEGARQNVELITEAEKILLDAGKRAAYDVELAGAKETKQGDIPKGEKDWLEMAWRYYEESDWEMARSAAKKATGQQSKNVIAWYLAGEIYKRLNDYENANEAAYEAILLDEDNPFAYGLRGDVYLLQKGSTKKALEQYEKMKARAAGNPEALQTAVEHIAFAKSIVIADQLDPVVNSIPETFQYNQAIMDQLRSVLSKLEDGHAKVKKLYDGLSSPSAWAKGVFGDALKDIESHISACEESIAKGEEYVLLPGFLRLVVGGVVIALISLVANLIIGVFVGIAVAAFGVLVFRKPRYKVR